MASKPNVHCCVPLCTQRGRVGPKGGQIGFFKFPDEEEMKKRWIHAFSLFGAWNVTQQNTWSCKRYSGAVSTSLYEMPSSEKDLNETLKQIRLLEKKYADLEKAVSETKIKHFSQMSSHLVGLPLMRQCYFIQVFLTTKYSWHPLNI